MIQEIAYKNTSIRFEDRGEGKATVLLHGYLESLSIWDEFSRSLARKHRVISIDLPGHGKTGILSDTSSMDDMAAAVKEVLDHLKIDTCTVFGHSMGGYVTLAFAEKYPERLNGFCLFHSAAKADTDEKKNNRQRTIELIKNGKKAQVVNGHVPKTFANDNVGNFSESIEWIRNLSMKTPDEGIMAALRGMMERPDRTKVLKGTKVPVLIIAGAKDNFIPMETAKEHASYSDKIVLEVFENSGHMGFFEEEEKALEVIGEFLGPL